MKKQAEILDSKEGRQNIFRIAKQKKKERKDITGTICLKGDNEGPADMISKEEVRQAIQDLKVRKAAGPSGVTAEMIKAAGE